MSDIATQFNDAQNYINDPNIEIAWAIKASEYSSVHMNILMSVDTTKLKLNKFQDDVYKYFRELFPDMDVFEINEVKLKGENKEKWRQFCEHFKETVDDYNFGTMLRIKADGIYDEANTIITQKVIFLAIEGARNIEGINEKFKEKYKLLYNQNNSDGNA
uniref:Polysaccharide biosynthesis domain-containing protein n=1 Tax=Meloidogyne floridensis TaxID=298350 RepID=A0A915PAA6_9BILA